MKDVLIIHSVYDKTSRDFVAAYGNRSEVSVIEDDGFKVRLEFPHISAFPTVIINTPSYAGPFMIDESGGGGFVNLSESGSLSIIPANIEYIRCPTNWQQVQERIDYWENKVPNWKQTDSRYL